MTAILLPYQSGTSPLSIALLNRKPSYGISATMTSLNLKDINISAVKANVPQRQTRTANRSVVQNKTNQDRHYRLISAAMSGNLSLDQLDPHLPAHVIEQFYSFINNGDTKKLQELISDDCFYEDEAFLDPFKGKKEVVHYLTELTKSMGKNVKFRIDRSFQGLDQTVGVLWHLDWRKTEIPFTRGCSLFECGKHGEKLVIKKAYVIVESPLKPGMSAVSLLKTVSSTFDRFPGIAEKFLQFQNKLIAWVVIMFNKFIKPFVLPLIIPTLMYYFNVWKLFWKNVDEIYNTYLRKIVAYVITKFFFPF